MDPFEDDFNEINEFSEQLDGCWKPFVFWVLLFITTIIILVQFAGKAD